MRTLLVALLVLATTAGCTGARACTLVDVAEGVKVEWPEQARLRQGFVALEVCDDSGCADTRQSIGRIPRGTPPIHFWNVEFASLGRDFEPGTVTATAEVIDRDGRTIVAGGGEVALTPSYPNGKECDGEGFLGGTLTLDEGDVA